jgi:ATP-dependent exoDNAse (exonuclease V) alpha subunit
MEERRGEFPLTEDEESPDARPQYEFITGTAGTGKTFLAREIAEAQPGAELCATTGIAAVNLGAGVTTINSKIGFFDTASLRDLWSQGFLTSKLARLWMAGTHRLVVDEVSMMDGEQLAILAYAIDELQGSTKGWPMGLTLVGDFCQLPPIKAKFPFEVEEVWERFEKNITKLTKIRRQTDLDFIEALQAVRRGDAKTALEYFETKLERTTVRDYDGPTILAKNAEVDRFNLLRHSMLKAPYCQWESTRWGKPRGEWKLIPNELKVKEGALVMILANQKELDEDSRPTGDYLYVNGDLGEVLGRNPSNPEYADVELRRTGRVVPVGKVTRENLIPLDKERRNELKARGEVDNIRGDKGQFEAVGGITYMPLRLAYATTVHKSQGLTLDDVQVSINDRFWETPGMVYVALSRARTSTGLRLVGSKELFLKRVRTDQRVRGWL